MFKRLFAAALGLLGVISSKVTGVDITPPSDILTKVPDVHHNYVRTSIPRGFMRINGTHGSTRRRRFKSLKAKDRHHGM